MMQTYLILFFGLVLTVAAQILMKLGMTKNGVVEFRFGNLISLFPKVFTNLYLLGGLVSLGLGFFLWLVVLSKLKLSIAIPFTSINYILILFFSWLFLKESISLLQLVGVATIIFGLFLVTR